MAMDDKSKNSNDQTSLDEAKKALREAESALEAVIKENVTLKKDIRQQEKEFVHDIKNLIMPVSGYMQLIEDGAMDSGMIQKYAGALLTSMIRVTELCDSMLGREPISAAKLPKDARYQDVKMGDIIEEVVEFFSQMAAEKNVTLTAEVSPDFPDINTIPQNIRRAMSNLVTNALNFTSSGGNVAIKAEVDIKDDAVVLVVRDSGSAIPTDQIMSILSPGSNVPGHKTERGSGLGLRIVYKMMQELGGTMAITSEATKGTTVTLSFPKSLHTSD